MTGKAQDRLFEKAIDRFGGAIARMARGYEADPELRRDLLQELQVALWQSFARFDARCAMSTWVWRVVHNRAASHVAQARKRRRPWVDIEDLALADEAPSPAERAETDQALALMLAIIDRLGPPDRQILLLYLEGMPAAEIADVTGVSSEAVATKVHRFKSMLTRRFAGLGDAT